MSERDVRQLAVYFEGRLVLVVRDNPGTLRSSAPPSPGAPPPPPPPDAPGDLPPGVHPFIDAQAYDPVTEGRLRALLDGSSSFDEYLEALRADGFTTVPVEPGQPVSHDLAG